MDTDATLLKQPFTYPPARCRCIVGHPPCPACQDEADAKRRQQACDTTLKTAQHAVRRAQHALKEVNAALKALEDTHGA